ncbi:uncharacterized protein LOC135337477 [Halichondria panicea]|uniref:uncharacterized protein LOC135337477 n=1 Tax=Halichondria panicea TaxID=6063 RepID=UPI00312B2E93
MILISNGNSFWTLELGYSTNLTSSICSDNASAGKNDCNLAYKQRSLVIHEFGHALGIEYDEHQRSDFWKDAEKLLDLDEGLKPIHKPQSKNTCVRVDRNKAASVIKSSMHDPSSVMHYSCYLDIPSVFGKKYLDERSAWLWKEPSKINFEKLLEAYKDVNPPRSIDLKMVQASPSIHNCQPDQSDVLQERRLLPCSPIHTWAGKKVLQVYFINPDILEKSVSIAKIMSWASTWNSPA